MQILHLAPDPAPLPLPFVGRQIPAGFPSPADDYLEGEIDLAAYLIERPAATFLIRVSGSSMTGAGILDGDILVVDRSIEAKSGHVVVAVCHGEMTVKRLRKMGPNAYLMAEHPDYPPAIIGTANPAEIWGVVVGCVRKMA